MDKAELVREARLFFKKRFPDIRPSAGCVFWAGSIIFVAQRHGIRLVPQAGSCFWPRIPPEEDDGIVSTEFGYLWEPTEWNLMKVLSGVLPEMHVWAGNPETQEVVDLSARYFPQQCRELTGAKWTMPDPPDYLWMPASEVAEKHGAIYHPTEEATSSAVHLLTKYLRENP